ncbi:MULTISPECIES: hypothetical protein [unclassified Halomonas]|uniref:tetratricopeptide repeat protein n=1 Tax=unclassified Halomonas TaxID=2609666 RepID=UPI002076B333|nr:MULTISPECIES: hypothetical protein [unclassified Halomonas]
MRQFGLSSILKCFIATIGSTGLATSLQAYQTELSQAKIMLSQKAPQLAYSELRAIEVENSGTPEFDYWLGVAALRAGEASHALMALDRAILRQPDHAGARLERVAALMRLDQFETAEREMNHLRDLSPPPDALEVIERFQALIDEYRHQKNGSKHNGFLGLEVGYDSNPQRLPSEIAIDPLRPELRRQVERLIANGWQPQGGVSGLDEQIFYRNGSSYQRIQGSYQGNIPINDHSRWQVGAISQSQRYTEEMARAYDLTLAQAQLGYERDMASQSVLALKGSALIGWSGEDQNHLLTRWRSDLDFTHAVGLDSKLVWRLGLERNDFDLASNDYHAGSLGIQLDTLYSDFRIRWSAQLEHEWANDSRDGGDLLGLSLGSIIDYPFSERHLIRSSFTHRIRSYQEDGFAFYNEFSDSNRRDHVSQARVSWLFQFDRNWLLETSAEAERRHSTIEFFDTSRYQANVALRYLF